MGTKLQDKQNMLEKGMKVFLLVRNVDGRSEPKRRPARVLVIMRGAVKIGIEGEKDRIVKLAAIEIDMDDFNARSMRKVAGDDGVPDVYTTTPKAAPVEAPIVHASQSGPPVLPEKPRSEKVEDEIETWLTMGRDLLAPIKVRCKELENELSMLADEYTIIGEQIQGAKDELDALNAKQRIINGKLREMEKAS